MKRIALTLLIFFYLASCVGVGVNSFYCCGKLISVNLTYGRANKAVKSDKCCNNKHQSFKLKDSQISTPSFSFKCSLPVTPASFTTANVNVFIKETSVNIAFQSNGPPRTLPQPIYTFNCTYKI